MRDLVSTLPQGLYWYPLVLGLLAYAGVVTIRLLRGDGRPDRAHRSVVSHGGGFTSLIAMARADRFSELELERLCLSYLLQANGYSGYSTAACRSFMEALSDIELVLAIQEHLGDAPRERRGEPAEVDERIAPLPPRCRTIISRLQSQIEEPYE